MGIVAALEVIGVASAAVIAVASGVASAARAVGASGARVAWGSGARAAMATDRAGRARRVMRPRPPAPRSNADERSHHHTGPAPVSPPPQDVSLLRRQCPQDRLQGRAPSRPLRLRARQNRTEPHYGGVGQEAA